VSLIDAEKLLFPSEINEKSPKKSKTCSVAINHAQKELIVELDIIFKLRSQNCTKTGLRTSSKNLDLSRA